VLTFQSLFCLFIALGCMLKLQAVLDFSDAMVFLIALPNILALYLYGPEVKRDVEAYLQRIRSTQ